MRRMLLSASLVVMLVGSLPGADAASAPACDASTTKRVCKVTFSAALPGTALTPYNSTDALGDGSLGFSTCGTPSPTEDSVDDLDFTIPGNGTAGDFNLATFLISPQVDYDSYICEIGDSENHNGIPNEILGSGANAPGDDCTGVLGPNDPSGVGCQEKSSIPVTQGKTYRFRVYNFSDPSPCPATITLTHVS
jgi:hypothetical protein